MGACQSLPPKVAQLKEGDRTVTGSAPYAERVLVIVYDHRKTFIEQKTGEVDATSSAFTVGLTRALAEGDIVETFGLRQSFKSDPTPVTVETAAYNWGRIRAYFSLGALSSNQDDNFQKVRPYVSLNLDKNWFNQVSCYEPPDWKHLAGQLTKRGSGPPRGGSDRQIRGANPDRPGPLHSFGEV